MSRVQTTPRTVCCPECKTGRTERITEAHWQTRHHTGGSPYLTCFPCLLRLATDRQRAAEAKRPGLFTDEEAAPCAST
jgi:hypothetical protein